MPPKKPTADQRRARQERRLRAARDLLRDLPGYIEFLAASTVQNAGPGMEDGYRVVPYAAPPNAVMDGTVDRYGELSSTPRTRPLERSVASLAAYVVAKRPRYRDLHVVVRKAAELRDDGWPAPGSVEQVTEKLANLMAGGRRHRAKLRRQVYETLMDGIAKRDKRGGVRGKLAALLDEAASVWRDDVEWIELRT